MRVQGRRKRGRPKRRWLDKVKDDIIEKGLSADDVYDRATWRRMSTSTPHKSGNKMKEKKNKKKKKSLMSFDVPGQYTTVRARALAFSPPI